MDPLKSIGRIAASGMRAQGERLKVVAENVANSGSTSTEPGGDPYRRKTVSFAAMVDRASGATGVRVSAVGRDMGEFKKLYDPSHPAADDRGYVKTPNVNTLVEMGDMREATRSYEANTSMFENGRAMMSRLVDLLRG